jgi:predicted nucleic acid-binding protein
MTVFVDTSAFLAVLNAEDTNHSAAKQSWERLLSQDETLVCTNYVLIETFALLQNRLGMPAVRAFQDIIAPLVAVEWADFSVHRAGVSALLVANRRQLSLVDCVSFEVMRSLGLTTAFAFDRHFGEQGFLLVK